MFVVLTELRFYHGSSARISVLLRTVIEAQAGEDNENISERRSGGRCLVRSSLSPIAAALSLVRLSGEEGSPPSSPWLASQRPTPLRDEWTLRQTRSGSQTIHAHNTARYS